MPRREHELTAPGPTPALPDSARGEGSPPAPAGEVAASPTTPAATRTSAPGDARSVTIKHIGMHVGGGPNDAATKAPFERALEGAFGAIRECCESVGCGSGTFGLDLLIPKTGGHAELTNPRTALAEPATRCITAALGEVQFASPRHGATKLSYSIRITPD